MDKILNNRLNIFHCDRIYFRRRCTPRKDLSSAYRGRHLSHKNVKLPKTHEQIAYTTETKEIKPAALNPQRN